ncbi:MAG: hypothetical protein KC613_16870, partial [Myxococcales bacterium]|nr:hypothetical protein [Myxococcales bacterium]
MTNANTSPLPPGAVAQAHVPAAALAEALKRMSQLGRNTPGLASWTFSPDGLRIAWMGMAELLEAEVTGAATLVVDGQIMHGLHHAGGWPEMLTVLARPTELKVAYTLIEAEQRPEPPPPPLPPNTPPRDVLAPHVREPPPRT